MEAIRIKENIRSKQIAYQSPGSCFRLKRQYFERIARRFNLESASLDNPSERLQEKRAKRKLIVKSRKSHQTYDFPRSN